MSAFNRRGPLFDLFQLQHLGLKRAVADRAAEQHLYYWLALVGAGRVECLLLLLLALLLGVSLVRRRRRWRGAVALDHTWLLEQLEHSLVASRTLQAEQR